VDDTRFADELRRMELHGELDKDRLKIAQYETGLAHFRQEIEQKQYELGRLDERLGT